MTTPNEAMRAALREIDPCAEEAYTDEQIARLVAAKGEAGGEETPVAKSDFRVLGWLYDWTHASALGKPDEQFTGFTTDEAYARKHDNPRLVYGAPVYTAAAAAGVPTLAQRIDAVAAQHGSLRNASRILDIDVGYLSRLRSGEKDDPSDEVLAKLDLRRVTSYERRSHPSLMPSLLRPPIGSPVAPAGAPRRLTDEQVNRLRELAGAIEQEFVRLEDLPAFIHRLQDEVRASRALSAGAPASPNQEG